MIYPSSEQNRSVDVFPLIFLLGSIILPLNGNLLGNPPLPFIKAKGLPMRGKNRTRLISIDFKIQRGTSGKWGGEFRNSLWQNGAAELKGMN